MHKLHLTKKMNWRLPFLIGMAASFLCTGCSSATLQERLDSGVEQLDAQQKDENENWWNSHEPAYSSYINSDGMVESAQNVTMRALNPQLEVLDADQQFQIQLSDWGYREIQYLNGYYFLVKRDDDKYMVIQSDTGEQVTDLGEGIDNTWDFVYWGLQNGSFAASVKVEEGYYHSYLFSRDMELINGWNDENDKYIRDYRDGLIWCSDQDKQVFWILYPDLGIDYTFKYEAGTVYDSISNGFLVTSSDFFENGSTVTDLGKFVLQMDSANHFDFMGEEVFPTSCVGEDGWLHAEIGDTCGFYNIWSGQYYLCPDGNPSYCAKAADCEPYCLNERTIVFPYVGEVDGQSVMRAFDFVKQKYVSECYTTIEAGRSLYRLVSNLDDQYSWVKSNSFEPLGIWFEDASGMQTALMNGRPRTITVVFNGEEMYLCELCEDEELRIASEAIDGTTASTFGLMSEFMIDDQKMYFRVKRDELYYLLTVNCP